MSKPKVHYAWEATYPESNEPSEWGTECGRDDWQVGAQTWEKVTCKRCLKIREASQEGAEA